MFKKVEKKKNATLSNKQLSNQKKKLLRRK